MAPSGEQRPVALVLADSALELVPKSLREHPSVLATAERTGHSPDRTLLDSSFHHRAMRKLPNFERRGRPDIVHVCALLALSSRVSSAGLLRLYIHTYDDDVISISPGTRLPRVYDRFKGLMEQLLVDGMVPKDDPLMVNEGISLKKFLGKPGSARVIGLSSRGRRTTWPKLLAPESLEQPTVILLGAFPRGDFREWTGKLATELASVADRPMEAWAVEGELLAHLATGFGLE